MCLQMLSTAVAAVSLHHGLKHSCTRALCSCGHGSQACIGATCQLTHLLPLTCSTTSPSPRFLDRQGWVSIMACHALSASGAHTRTISFLHTCAHKLTQSTCCALQVQHACICMSFRRLTIRGFLRLIPSGSWSRCTQQPGAPRAGIHSGQGHLLFTLLAVFPRPQGHPATAPLAPQRFQVTPFQ